MRGTLFAEVAGGGAGPPVALLHGFTQTRSCWGTLPRRLVEAGHEVRGIDLPGHGRSGHAEVDLWDAARLVTEAAGRAVYLGYSFGGRVALHAALAHPAQVAAVVLVGASPGIEDPAERSARRAADDVLAERIERLGVAAFLEEWLAQPLFAGLPAGAACVEARLENRAGDLAASLRRCGTGAQEPLWDRLAGLSMPVLCVAGEEDTKFAALAGRMVESIGPPATLALVPGAGHTAHLEQPDAFWSILSPWLQAHAP